MAKLQPYYHAAATTGTIIAAGYPLIDSERQSLARRIDAAIAAAIRGVENHD